MTERVNRIIQNQQYQENLRKNEEWEVDRIYCKHDMVHFLDVARIGEIINLKEHMDISEEYIYATALLHDIGRHVQYQDGTRHEQASAPIAQEILEACGYEEAEQKLILSAILHHRTPEVREERTLDGIIYRADKLSRGCYACKAEAKCDWKGDKKNLELVQ